MPCLEQWMDHSARCRHCPGLRVLPL